VKATLLSIATRYGSVVCMTSVTLVHPAKAVGRDNRVVPINVLHRGDVLPREGYLGVGS